MQVPDVFIRHMLGDTAGPEYTGLAQPQRKPLLKPQRDGLVRPTVKKENESHAEAAE